MKKIYLFLFLAIIGVSAVAQSKNELKPFKVDASIGYAIPGGTGAKGGVLAALEPKYAVMSNLSLGLRFEAAVVARFAGYDADGNPNDVSAKASGSYLATADYYFTNNYSLRPFAGGGAGIFTMAGEEISSGSGSVTVGSKFGGMIRAGVEISHFRAGIEYNLIPKTTYTGYDSNGNLTEGLTSKNSYIGIKVGVCFGGGPRK
jgi:hypothetical protein